MLGLTPAQVRSYANQTVLHPDRGPRGELRFGFHDLILLRTASELAAAQIPGRKVRRALERLREQLPEGRSLTAVRIAADGDDIVVSDGNAMWNPVSGQSLFDFSVAEIEEKATPIHRAEDSADRWFELALELEDSSIDEAKAAYERALQVDPQHADSHVNLGRILHEENAPAAAEPHYAAALQADPEHSTAAFNLGVALEDLGRIGDAIDAYEKAIAIDPSNADAHYNVAGLYEQRGERAAALAHLKMCRKLAK